MTPRVSAALRRAAIAAAAVSLALIGVQMATGGFRVHVFGLRISNNSYLRPIAALLISLAVLVRSWGWAAVATKARRFDAFIERASSVGAAAAAALALTVGFVWGTRAAGGSDSYCYIGQAEEFAAGRATLAEPLARVLPLPRADLIFAPVGFVPGPAGAAVPMCAPGLSLVMAVAWQVGGEAGLHAVVPALGALAVWCTFLLGVRLADGTTGMCAAWLLGASPIFLYQIVQPMSDVPAAAFWSAAMVLASSVRTPTLFGAGVAASLALLTRPNLAPCLVPLAGFILRRASRHGLVKFLVGLAPGSAVLLALNHVRYGSPFRSGYGDLGHLFALSHVGPNAARYFEWMMESHTPIVLLGLAAPLLIKARVAADDSLRRALIWTAFTFVLVVVGCYLPYTVFDAWWYIRFLLPALPCVFVLTSDSLVTLASRTRVGSFFLVPMLAVLLTWYVSYARTHEVFRLKDLERRYITAGTLVGRTLPANAIVITIQQSGAVRHYGRRPAALWDAIAPDALDETVRLMEDAGLKPYILIEEGERQEFRARFKGEVVGALDWPASVEVRDRVTVWLYDPAERTGAAR